MAKSVVTPERFSKGRTFDEYVRYTGSAENLAREAFGAPTSPTADRWAARGGTTARSCASATRGAAQRAADRGHQVARGPARRPREDPRDLRGLVVGLPARRADAGAAGRGRRAGAAHLQSGRPARFCGERRPDPAAAPTATPTSCRVHQRQERRRVASMPGGGVLHEGLPRAAPLHRVPRDLPQGPRFAAIRGARPGETAEQTQEARRPRVRALQHSPFFDLWACGRRSTRS